MKRRVFTLEVTDEQLRVIEAGLKELPGKYCMPLIEAIAKQLSEQTNEVKDDKPEKKEKEKDKE